MAESFTRNRPVPETTPSSSDTTFVLLGASVRAAAESIRRVDSAVHLIAIDRFGDVDTKAICQQWFDLATLDPPKIAAAIDTAAVSLVAVGGGLGTLGRELATHFPAANHWNLAEDPSIEQLQIWANQSGLRVPKFQFRRPSRTADGWLVKPIGGCGGLGITRFDHTQIDDQGLDSEAYFQQYVSGKSIGINFRVDRGQAVFVGAASHDVRRIGRQPFVYAGSRGPTDLGQHRPAILRLAAIIAAETCGVLCFNIDVIIDAHLCSVLEVNLRYSASMEIFERLSGNSVLLPRSGDDFPPMDPAIERSIEKSILYADETTEFDLRKLKHRFPKAIIADYPPDQTIIPADQPICTLIRKVR